jgi:hypothetical protein
MDSMAHQNANNILTLNETDPIIVNNNNNNNNSTSHKDNVSLNNYNLNSSQFLPKQSIGSFVHDVPNIKFRDVVLAKKFGSSPYDSDR